MCRSSGTITVGPVTVTTAPNSADADHDMPVRVCANQAAPTAVTATPMVSKLRTGTPTLARRFGSRDSPPSNRMIATPRWISASSASPNAAGCTRPMPPGPHKMPSSSSGRIAGSWNRSAMTWPAMPSATAATNVVRIVSMVVRVAPGMHRAGTPS
jgi:hypothetical protein